MNQIAKFEKVSFDQFFSDVKKMSSQIFTSDYYPEEHEEQIRKIWEDIKLPKRSTSGSAGYDFFFPFDKHNMSMISSTIPTGIRCKIDEGWVLQIYPRSSLGFKYNMRLANTVGIIDSDYYNANNEGHIMIRSHSSGNFNVMKGDKFVQGIFVPFGVAIDDDADGERTGGMGSTGK